jgi:YVTN family beta-propeller protein
VALGTSRDGARLFVANRRSGSLSVIDLREQKLTSEHEVGLALADLAVLPDGRHLLVVDQGAGALLLLEERDGAFPIVGRQPIDAGPATLLAASEGTWCVIASLWSRALTFLSLEGLREGEAPRLASAHRLELPFSPRTMVLAGAASATRLIVADAFGGRLAVVDPGPAAAAAAPALELVHTLPAQNLRGMAVSPDGRQLVIAHQVLSRLARTTFEDVHWGSLLTNDLRVLELDQLLGRRAGADPLRNSRLVELGATGNGSGDPSALAFTPSGRLLLVLSGVDQIRIGPDPDHLTARAGVGRQPTAVAIRPDGLAAYVASTLDDTVSVVDIATGLDRGTIALGPRPELTAADRGERVFSDARLSHDGWMSCQSCHTDGHTSSRSADTLGDGGFGAPKRIPSLLGVGTTGPWGWLGNFARLEDQVRQSVASTMQGSQPSEAVVSDLIAYLQTLAPPPPPRPSEHGNAERGRQVFRAQGCAECHAPPEFTRSGAYDVGLADEVGQRHFNPPSLRGVGQREPLLHDGRAAGLDAVFRVHRHPRDNPISPDEIADLVAYLRTL